MCKGFAPSACQEVIIPCETQRAKEQQKNKNPTERAIIWLSESKQMEIVKKKSLFFFLATVNKERQIKVPHLEAIRRFGLTQIGVSESFFLRHLSQQREAIVVGTGAHGTAALMAACASNALAGSSFCSRRIPPLL